MVLILHLNVLYGLFTLHNLTVCFLEMVWGVFTARYALSPYIKQARFVFKGLIRNCAHHSSTEATSTQEYPDVYTTYIYY